MSGTEPRIGASGGDQPEQGPESAGGWLDKTRDLSAGGLPQLPGITIHNEIARGGMGVVYSGRQDFLDRRVAVKFLSIDLTNDAFAQRFQREAKILAGISHPNIVSCHMADTTPGGQSYLVMEFIDGPSLKAWVAENGAASPMASLRLIRATGAALAHAYLSDIIHRDVKPENVLLETVTSTALDVMFPYTPKLVDLGLARMATEQVGTGLTSPGSVMGTPLTMSPEQFDDPDSVDFRSDIYGLGCCLYEMLAGKPAFTGTKLTDIVLRKRDPNPPNPCDDNPSIPPEVGAYTQRLLAPSRDDRPSTYKELDRELAALIELLTTRRSGGVDADLGQTVPSRPGSFGGAATQPSAASSPIWAAGSEPPTAVAQGAAAPKGKGGKVAAIAVLALVAAVVGVVFATGGSDPDRVPGNGGSSGGGEAPPPQPNRAPVARIESAPSSASLAEKFVISVQAADEDGDVLKYEWDWPRDAIALSQQDGSKAEFVINDGLPGVAFTITASVTDGRVAEPVRLAHSIVVGECEAELPLVGYLGKREWVAEGSWTQLMDPTRANAGVSGRAKSGPATLSAPIGDEVFWEWSGALEPTEDESGSGEALVAFTFGEAGHAVRARRDEDEGRWDAEVVDRVPGQDAWAARVQPVAKSWIEAEGSIDSNRAWLSVRREREALVFRIGQLVQPPARAGERPPPPSIVESDPLRIGLTEKQQAELSDGGRITLVTQQGRCVFQLERR